MMRVLTLVRSNAAMTLSLMLITAMLMNSQAQTPVSDFRKVADNMKQQFANVEKLHIRMSINVYETAGSSPYFSTTADVLKDGASYHYKYNLNNFLMNDTHVIMVDHTEREIMVSRRNLKSEEIFRDPVQLSLDSVLSRFGTPAFIDHSGSVEHFRLVDNGSFISQVDFFIDTKTNVFSRIEYHYNDNQLAVIDFSEFNSSPSITPDMFNETQYVVKVNGKFKPADGFGNYRIVQ